MGDKAPVNLETICGAIAVIATTGTRNHSSLKRITAGCAISVHRTHNKHKPNTNKCFFHFVPFRTECRPFV